MPAAKDNPVVAAAAVGMAAFVSLLALFPDDQVELERAVEAFKTLLAGSVDNQLVVTGSLWGKQVATALLDSREGDGAFADEPFKVLGCCMHSDCTVISFYFDLWCTALPVSAAKRL